MSHLTVPPHAPLSLCRATAPQPHSRSAPLATVTARAQPPRARFLPSSVASAAAAAMSRSPYQRMGNDGSSPRGGPGGASGARSPASPRGGDAANVKHAARHAADADDPQAPWLTHLEYSVDPLIWDDDNKFPACPLCQSAFVVSMMGSGRHHCRMWSVCSATADTAGNAIGAEPSGRSDADPVKAA